MKYIVITHYEEYERPSIQRDFNCLYKAKKYVNSRINKYHLLSNYPWHQVSQTVWHRKMLGYLDIMSIIQED